MVGGCSEAVSGCFLQHVAHHPCRDLRAAPAPLYTSVRLYVRAAPAPLNTGANGAPNSAPKHSNCELGSPPFDSTPFERTTIEV